MNSIRQDLIDSGDLSPAPINHSGNADPQAVLMRRRLDPVTPAARAMNVLYEAAARPPVIVLKRKPKKLMAALFRPTPKDRHV